LAWEADLRDRAQRRRRAEARSARRCAALADVFRLRGEGCVDFETWSALLAPGFELWQPVAKHQSYRPADVVGARRVSRGVRGMLEDVASLGVMMRSIGRRSSRAPSASRRDAPPRFECAVLSPAVSGGDHPDAVLPYAETTVHGFWATRTLDARDHGSAAEVGGRGMYPRPRGKPTL